MTYCELAEKWMDGWMDGWDGMGWDGMGWDGMGLDGMGWDGMDGWMDREVAGSVPG